jgi:RNA polymerase sigma-70 factor, ECF subfamily
VDRLTRLAHDARLGDRRALDAFVHESYADVWRLCRALVDQQAADDLAQETFLRATCALRRFRGESSARTWVLAIARRACMDELRARTRRARRARRLGAGAQEAHTAPDPAGGVAANEMLRLLHPDRRAAFVLTQIFRLSYQDAATVCGCPPGTIRSRVARARDELIELMVDAPETGAQLPRQRP